MDRVGLGSLQRRDARKKTSGEGLNILHAIERFHPPRQPFLRMTPHACAHCRVNGSEIAAVDPCYPRPPRGAIHGFRSGAERAKDERRVRNRPRHRAEMIEARGEREHAVHRHGIEARFEPDRAAQCRRNPHRASCIRSKGQRHHASCNGSGAARAGTARHATHVVWISCGALQGPVPGRTIGELVGQRLSNDDRPGRTQRRHACGIA